MITSHPMWHSLRMLGKSVFSTWPSAVVALIAFISIIVCIDPAGSYPSMPQGPGLTVDEIFNVEQGVYLVESARALGWYNLIPGTSIEAFRPENGYNPDHPPLGRYWLGVLHQLVWWLAPPHQPDGVFVTACARVGSATAFALTVWLIGAYVGLSAKSGTSGNGSLFQSWQAPLACIALVLMPRVYGHAHLAALESVTNLTCTAAVLAVAAWWARPSAPTWRASLLAGVLMGLALLTKIQAILIPFPIIVWALLRWRQRAIVPLLIWGIAALAVFAMWPYLWLDPIEHFREYLGRATKRMTLYCYYFGTRYADKEVPWHYPFVMFAITVPVGLHLLGLWGTNAAVGRTSTADSSHESAWRIRLLLACGLFPLIVFAIPGTAVYDGERLFLTVYPLWAPVVAGGALSAMRLMATRIGASVTKVATCALVLAQFVSNWQIHPTYLSYYNLAIGGLSGADKLGMEMNYWGDAVTRDLLEQAVAKCDRFESLEIKPSLHQFQRDDLMRQSPILRRHIWLFVGHDHRPQIRLAFRRRAELSDDEFLQYPHLSKSRLAGFEAE